MVLITCWEITLFPRSAIGAFGIQTSHHFERALPFHSPVLLSFFNCHSLQMSTNSEKLREVPPSDDSLDWDALRLRSLAPGGFGSRRAYIWYASFPLHHSPFPLNFEFTFRPRLLHVDVNRTHPPENEKEHDLHKDEQQIRLDTDRSFVLYPVGDALSILASLHSFHSRIIGRRRPRRCKTCASSRAQQTHRATFPTSPRFELLSSPPLNA